MELDPGPKSRYRPPGRDLRPVVIWIVLGALAAAAIATGSCVACVGFGSAEPGEGGATVEEPAR